jgi:hypothetical protein
MSKGQRMASWGRHRKWIIIPALALLVPYGVCAVLFDELDPGKWLLIELCVYVGLFLTMLAFAAVANDI